MTPKAQNLATNKMTFANLGGRLASLFALLAIKAFIASFEYRQRFAQ